MGGGKANMAQFDETAIPEIKQVRKVAAQCLVKLFQKVFARPPHRYAVAVFHVLVKLAAHSDVFIRHHVLECLLRLRVAANGHVRLSHHHSLPAFEGLPFHSESPYLYATKGALPRPFSGGGDDDIDGDGVGGGGSGGGGGGGGGGNNGGKRAVRSAAEVSFLLGAAASVKRQQRRKQRGGGGKRLARVVSSQVEDEQKVTKPLDMTTPVIDADVDYFGALPANQRVRRDRGGGDDGDGNCDDDNDEGSDDGTTAPQQRASNFYACGVLPMPLLFQTLLRRLEEEDSQACLQVSV
jgi:hypothetical protein